MAKIQKTEKIMDSIVENYSQKSKQSQDSFDWTEFDNVLDLDQPPTFNSTICSLGITSYPSKLILARGTQRNKSKADSGFDTDESRSSTFHSQSSQVSFEGQKNISNHSLSPASSLVDSSDVDSECTFSPIAYSLPSKKSRLESPLQPAKLTRLPNHESLQEQTDETSDNETVESDNYHANATVSSDGNDNWNDDAFDAIEQSPSNRSQSLSNPIHLKIAPVLNLMAQIKTQYTDYAFVYALAAHMCKGIYPRDCHISLKTALLLSIVSCNV